MRKSTQKGASNNLDVSTMTVEEIMETVRDFSYDVETCGKRLKSGDDWQRIIQSHLFFDHIIARMVSEELKRPDEISLDRMAFSAKLDLAASLGLIDSEFKGFLRKLNSLRNSIAHNLTFKVRKQNVDQIYGLAPQPCRVLIDEELAKGHPRLVSCLLVGVVILDILRQKHVARRLIEKKRQIELRDAMLNAKRVLEKYDSSN